MQPFDRLSELIEDWKYLIRRDGMRPALFVVGLEVVRLPYRHMRFLLLARSLSEPLPDLQPKVTLDIRRFTEIDLDLVRQIDRPSEVKLCARRLKHGHAGLLALHETQPVGHAWACIKIDPGLERVHPKLEPGDVLCADVYTNPAFRGRGIHTALTLARFRLFRDLGYRRAISYIEMRNAPSLAVWQRKLESVTIGQVDFIRVGPWYRVHYNLDHPTNGPASNTRLAQKDGDK
jgi:GNAT superfamily N-acetyltransferase